MIFSVIVENIKSFFSKEEQLEKDPGKLPQSASDVFEKPASLNKKFENRIGSLGIVSNKDVNSDNNPNKGLLNNLNNNLNNQNSKFNKKIIDKDLPKNNNSNGLKYSSAQLKERLRAKQGLSKFEVDTNEKKKNEKNEATNNQELITPDEIKAFEQAINGIDSITTGESNSFIPRGDGVSNINDATNKNYLSESSKVKKSLEGGFFSEYEKNLINRNYDLDSRNFDGNELINKMHDYHNSKLEGKEYHLHKEDLELAIKKKIADLKEYEYEWFDLKEREQSIKRAMNNIEEDIKKKSSELKSLVSQINSDTLLLSRSEENEQGKKVVEEKKELLENKEQLKQNTAVVPNPNAFFLADGRAINNLDELREALRTMPDAIFYQHISPNRNDFATWIADSLGREELSLELRKCSNKYEMINKLNHKWA